MEIHFLAIEAIHLGHIPITKSKLLHHGAIHQIEIDVVVAALFGGHQETVAIVEEGPVVGDVDVIIVGLVVKHAAVARGGIGCQNLQMVLVTVEALDGQDIRVFGPLHTGQVDVGLGARIHLHRLTSGKVVHVVFNDAVVLTCLGVFETVPFGIEAFKFFHLELLHVRLVELHVGDLLAVGRPAVALRETEFLLVDPVGGTINNMIIEAIMGELKLFSCI